MTTLLAHASWLSWSTRAVRAANVAWRKQTPYRGETIMSREALNHHLFRWAVRTRLVEDPGLIPKAPYSVYVASVFAKNPELVKKQARKYWRQLVEEQHASQ